MQWLVCSVCVPVCLVLCSCWARSSSLMRLGSAHSCSGVWLEVLTMVRSAPLDTRNIAIDAGPFFWALVITWYKRRKSRVGHIHSYMQVLPRLHGVLVTKTFQIWTWINDKQLFGHNHWSSVALLYIFCKNCLEKATCTMYCYTCTFVDFTEMVALFWIVVSLDNHRE